MTAPLGLHIPSPEWPVVGNNIPVAFFFILHIAVAEYSAGAIAIAPFMEAHGVRSGDPRAMRYARKLTNSYYLVFSLGATLAVFAVVTLIGLWGREFGDLINVFLPLIGVIFGLFLLVAPLLVLYKNSFESMSPVPHVALGFTVAVLQNLFVVGITAVDTYLITPNHAGLVDGALNAPYTPLVLHRLIGNVSWTALFLAGFAAIRLARAYTEEERVFQAWAARINVRIGLLTAVLMPIDGFALMEVLKGSQPGFFFNLVNGGAAWLFIVQEVLFGGLLVAGNLALALEQPVRPGGDGVGRVAVTLVAAGMVLGVMPSQVIGPGVDALRYAGIGVAAGVTLIHLLFRSIPERTMPRLAPAPGAATVLPYTASSRARASLLTVAALGVVTALFMGYMKEQARGSYSFYGELTQDQGRGPFTPPTNQLYP